MNSVAFEQILTEKARLLLIFEKFCSSGNSEIGHFTYVWFDKKFFRDEIPLTEKVLISFTKSVPLGAVMVIFGLLSSTFRLWDQGFTNLGCKSGIFHISQPVSLFIPDFVYTYPSPVYSQAKEN